MTLFAERTLSQSYQRDRTLYGIGPRITDAKAVARPNVEPGKFDVSVVVPRAEDKTQSNRGVKEVGALAMLLEAHCGTGSGVISELEVPAAAGILQAVTDTEGLTQMLEFIDIDLRPAV